MHGFYRSARGDASAPCAAKSRIEAKGESLALREINPGCDLNMTNVSSAKLPARCASPHDAVHRTGCVLPS